MNAVGEGVGGTNGESSIKTHTLPYEKLIAVGNLLNDAGNSNLVLCDDLDGWGGVQWELGRRFKGEGIYVYLWVIHVDVCQKPT